MCKCKLCGGVAKVYPPTEEIWNEKELSALSVDCGSCHNVVVWAYDTDGETYADIRRVAEERWDKLMGEEDEY